MLTIQWSRKEFVPGCGIFLTSLRKWHRGRRETAEERGGGANFKDSHSFFGSTVPSLAAESPAGDRKEGSTNQKCLPALA